MVMKMVEAQTQTVEEMLLEGAKRIGELAEKEAQEAEKNATISENVSQSNQRNTNFKNHVAEEIRWPTS